MVPSSSSASPSSTVSVQEPLDVNEEDWMQEYPLDKDPHSAATSDFEYEDDVEATPGIRPERLRPRWGMRGIMALIAAALSPRESRRAADARPLLAPSSSSCSCSSGCKSSSARHCRRLKLLLRCLCYPLLGLLVML